MGDTVPELAARSREREFLRAFQDGFIQHEHHNVNFGGTDLALIEKVIEQVEQGQNLLVVNPFSYPLVPATIAVTYMLSSDARVADEERTVPNTPMVLLPKEGYIQDLEGFNYRDTVSGGNLVEKTNVARPSDFTERHEIYRVTDTAFISEAPGGWSIGLMFVDLRKDIWKSELAVIEEFAEQHDVGSVVFYTDERDYATEIVEDMVDDTIEISRAAMEEASHGPLGENPTRARVQERIIADGVDVTTITVEAPDLVDQFNELYGVRREIQEEIEDLHAVPKLHNLLTELAVRPSVYDEQVMGNFYYSSSQQLIDGVQSFIERADEANVDLLQEFWRTATEIRDHLEESNPKEKIFKEQVEEAIERESETVFVARNRAHRDSIKTDLFANRYDDLEGISVQTRKEVEPSLDTTVVFVNLPGYRHRLYEFPPSAEMRFIVYPFLVKVVERELSEAETSDDPDRQVVRREQIERVGEPETVTIDPLDLETDVAASFTGGASAGGPGTGSGGEPDDHSGIEVRLNFGDGSSMDVDGGTRMTIFDDEKDTVRRRRAEELVPGHRVVVMDEAATDLYEVITRQQHQTEVIRRREKLIDRWREILREGLEEEMDAEELHREMVERGSELMYPMSIEQWRDGSVLGPRDPKDVRLVLEILRPGSESAFEEIVAAMKYIRTLHQRIGQRVKRMIEVEIDPTRTATFDSGIGSELDNIEDKINVKRVTNTSAL